MSLKQKHSMCPAAPRQMGLTIARTEGAEGRLFGPSRTSNDVRFRAAVGGRADITARVAPSRL
jgi:hypothetical protein